MAIRLKPKVFGPVVTRFDGQSEITFAMGEDGAELPHPPYDTPVDTLLASIGYCLVKSIQIVAGNDKLDAGPFDVSVHGDKATDLPGRLQRVRCDISGVDGWASGQEADIIARAKAMCTVSNTLNCEVVASAGR